MNELKRFMLFPKEYDGKELTLDLTLVTRWSWGTKAISEDLNHHIFSKDEAVQVGDFIFSRAMLKNESDDLTNEFAVLIVTNDNENAINSIMSNSLTKGRIIKVKARTKTSMTKNNLIVYLIIEDIIGVVEKPKKKSLQDDITDTMLDVFGLSFPSENDE